MSDYVQVAGILDSMGPFLSQRGACQVMGDISVNELNHRIDENEVVAIWWDHAPLNKYMYPARQFDDDGKILPQVRATLEATIDAGHGFDGFTVWAWMCDPEELLDGRRPLDCGEAELVGPVLDKFVAKRKADVVDLVESGTLSFYDPPKLAKRPRE
jgi:hypothetical protein